MPPRLRIVAPLLALVTLLTGSPPVLAQPAPAPAIEEKTRGLERKDGYLPLYWDARARQGVDGDPAAR